MTHPSSSRKHPLEFVLKKHRGGEIYDRLMPEMDVDYAQSLVLTGKEERKGIVQSFFSCGEWSEAYQRLLVDNFNINRRILRYKSNPSIDPIPTSRALSPTHHKAKPRRRHISQTAEGTLDAPGLIDDFYLNLLDWGSNDILAIALGTKVYLWDASTRSASELVTVADEDGPVTSISWARDGRHLAVGLESSHVQLWDSTAVKLIRTLRGGHHNRVGSLAWNNDILTTGGIDGKINNNDVRVRSSIVQTYIGHQQEVCGLKWSASGHHLASGGNDNLVFIWDMSAASTDAQWLHRLQDHTAAVRALSWCPFQRTLLASGGGLGDGTIKFWNSHTGACLNSVDTDSQVCALQWNRHERELLSSHGSTQNKLLLWKYPSMVRMAELIGHSSTVLHMTQSPDGYTVASASGDETLRFWNVFGIPEVKKPAEKENPLPFSPRYYRIR